MNFACELPDRIARITKEIQGTPWIDLGSFGPVDSGPIIAIIEKHTKGLNVLQKERIQSEFFGAGPIQSLLGATDITEILINGPIQIWVERLGMLEAHNDHFYSDLTFKNFV